MLGISLVVCTLADVVIDRVNSFYSDGDLNKELIVKVSEIDDIYCDFGIDELVINLGDLNEYLHNKSGFDDNQSKYISYITLNKNKLYLGSIRHELKHIYIDWRIFNNNGKAIKDSKEVKELYTSGFESLLTTDKEKIPRLIILLRCFYYTTKLEIPAFLENHYFDSSYFYKNHIKTMLGFDFNKLKTKECEKEFNIIKSYDIPRINKFKTYDKFLSYCNKFFKIRGEYILRKINNIDYLKKINKC
tara:strand:+ start:1056 stop:1793 length:738 start_codon:yes stop_codon:yes gene_type:complete